MDGPLDLFTGRSIGIQWDGDKDDEWNPDAAKLLQTMWKQEDQERKTREEKQVRKEKETQEETCKQPTLKQSKKE